MSVYYQDDLVTLHRGRCEDVLPTLELSGSVHLLTDPPYFKVKADDWDNQWSKAAGFLDWMGEWLDLAKPHLSADASVWVFASPELTSAVESVVAQRFRVLNSVRWVKPQGWHMKADLDAARSFLSPWEGIIFAEQPEDAYSAQDYLSHQAALLPAGEYLRGMRESVGLSRPDLGAVLAKAAVYRDTESAVANISNQETGSKMLSKAAHAAWSLVVPLKPFAELQADYERLRRVHTVERSEYARLRRPFQVADRSLASDVWTFDTVAAYAGKHVCEKPVGLLTHMIETTTRPGDTIIDCFAGSGAVLDVARQLGRKAVGIEMSAKWCASASRRLSQQAFDFTDLEEATG